VASRRFFDGAQVEIGSIPVGTGASTNPNASGNPFAVVVGVTIEAPIISTGQAKPDPVRVRPFVGGYALGDLNAYDSYDFRRYLPGSGNYGTGAAFSPDGLRMFTADWFNHRVYQYDLLTPFRVSSAVYRSNSFVSTSAEGSRPFDVAFSPDGLSMYVVTETTNKVFQYTLAEAWNVVGATYSGLECDTSAQTTTGRGLAFNGDGTKMYVGGTSGNVYEYALGTAWDVSSASHSVTFSVTPQTGTFVFGVDFSPDGTRMFVMSSASIIYSYTLSTPWLITSATYDSKSVDSSIQTALVQGFGFTPDGMSIVFGGGSQMNFTQYDLTTAWDVSTAAFRAPGKDISAQHSNTTNAFDLSPDGTRMWIVGYNCVAYQYDLSTPNDVSTAVYNGVSKNFYSDENNNNIDGFRWSADGMHLFTLGTWSKTVRRYPAAVPFSIADVTVGGYDQTISSAFTGFPHFDISLDGTRMYVIANGSVATWVMSTAWDLTSATNIGNVSLGTFPASSDLTFNDDGTKMYFISVEGFGATRGVRQFSLSTPWDVATASRDTNSNMFWGKWSTQTMNCIKFTAGQQSLLLVGGDDFVLDIAYTAQPPTINIAFGMGPVTPVIHEPFMGDLRLDVGVVVEPQIPDATVASSIDATATPAVVDILATLDAPTILGATIAVSPTPIHIVAVVGGYGLYDLRSYRYFEQRLNPTDTSVQEVALSADGTKLFVLGTTTDTVQMYRLPIPWELDGAVDSGVTFSVASQSTSPEGLAFSADGTKMFVVADGTEDTVYQYTLSTAWELNSASYTSSFSVAGQDTRPRSIAFKTDGTKMYVGGWQTDRIYEYALSSAWDVTTASYGGVNFAPGLYFSHGIAFSPDGTRMFLHAYELDSTRSYTLSTPWLVSSATYDSKSLSTLPLGGATYGVAISPDGTRLYSPNNEINQYNLSTPFDLDTAVHPRVYEFTPSFTSQQVAFRPDGLRMYIIVDNTMSVYQHTLTTPWQVDTAAAHTVSKSISSGLTWADGLDISSDGLKLFVTDRASDAVHQFDMTVAWDLSTLSASPSTNFSLSGQSGSKTCGSFSDDGLNFYAMTSTVVYHYTLTAAWDLSTMAYVASFSHGRTTPSHVQVSPDGRKMHIIDESGTDTVYQYTLATAYAASTASIDSGATLVLVGATGLSEDLKGMRWGNSGRYLYLIGRGGADERVRQAVLYSTPGISIGLGPPTVAVTPVVLDPVFFDPDTDVATAAVVVSVVITATAITTSGTPKPATVTVFAAIATVFLLDPFQRDDGSLGADWTTVTGTNDPEIVDGAASAVTAGVSAAYWSGDLVADDQFAEIVVSLDGADEVAVIVRSDGTTDNQYAFAWDGDNYALSRTVAGVTTVLDSSSGHGSGGTRVLRIEAVDDQIVAYADDVEQLSATDSTLTSGAPAIAITATPPGNAPIERFKGGSRNKHNVATTATPTPPATAIIVNVRAVSLPAQGLPATVAIVPAVHAAAITVTVQTFPSSVAVLVTIPAPVLTASGTPAPNAVAVIAVVGFIDVTASATTSPAVVAIAPAVTAPTITATGRATPAVVPIAPAVPAPSITASGTASPAVVTISPAIGAPTITASATTTPPTVVIASVIGAPSITASGTASPATVAVAPVVNAPTITASGVATPATVVISPSIDAPTITASATITPAVVTISPSIGAPSITATGTASPTTVPIAPSVGAPTVTASGTTTPSTVEVSPSVGAPTITATAVITPAAVPVAPSISAPTITATGTASPLAVVIAPSVHAPTITASGTASPTTVPIAPSVADPTITASGTTTPSTVPVAPTVGAPAITATATVLAVTVAVAPSIGAPTVTASSTVTPSTIVITPSIGAPTVTASATPIPSSVAVAVVLHAPNVAASDLIGPATVAIAPSLGAPTVTASGAASPNAVAIIAVLGAPSITATGTASPLAVVVAPAIFAPSITATGTATPATVVVAPSVNAPSIAASGTASPLVVAVAPSIGAPSITASGTASPNTVVVGVTVTAPTITASGIATPATVIAIAAIGAPTVAAGTNPTPAPIVITPVVHAPTVTASSATTPPTVVIAPAIGAPTITASGVATPAVVAIGPTVGAPTITASGVASPDTVGIVTVLGAPTITASGTTTPNTVEVTVTVGAPTITATGTATPDTVTIGPIVNAATVVISTTVTVADPIGIADTVTSQLIGEDAATVIDPVGVTDTVTVAIVRAVSVVDPIGVVDDATTANDLDEPVSDVVGLADTVTAALTITVAVVDPVGIGDELDDGVTDYLLVDVVGIGDVVAVAVTRPPAAGFVTVEVLSARVEVRLL
jgi:sugar lactone lactonase YvrE